MESGGNADVNRVPLGKWQLACMSGAKRGMLPKDPHIAAAHAGYSRSII
jgi:hypothetical protein